MATFDTPRTLAGASLGARALHMISCFIGVLSAWNDARITRKSLSRLSARELDDIGLCRGDIDAIANRGRV